MINNNSYRKYQIILEQDQKWGFYVTTLGSKKTERGEKYPSKGHPGSYMFSWEKGRILDEYQFVLITQGQGIFENNVIGRKKISAGDGFLLFPGVWHRYKPKKKTGWTEHWLGFSGTLLKQFFANGFFNQNTAVIQKCNHTSVLNYFDSLFKLFNDEPFGYQRLASGICLQLLATLYNIQQTSSNKDSLNNMVSHTKHLMYEQIDTTINLEQIASDFGVSYSKFRADFKKQTGTSPLQYFILLKIEKSKELLLHTNKSQKEIAYILGFESDYYFNRLFKQKVGITPRNFRENRK